MTDNFTPTTDEVRTAYKAGGGYRWPERGEHFYSVLAALLNGLHEEADR